MERDAHGAVDAALLDRDGTLAAVPFLVLRAR
jgi:hypothetical protein